MRPSSPHLRESDTVRVRIEVRAVLEYDARLSDYDTSDPAEVVKSDQETAEDDIYLFLDNENTKWEIKVRPA